MTFCGLFTQGLIGENRHRRLPPDYGLPITDHSGIKSDTTITWRI